MNPLVDGAKRFLGSVFPGMRSLFETLAKGQQPPTLFVTCADSRIDPHLITGSEPGSLFVVRNAGNIVPPYGQLRGGEAASIEYAVAALGVQHVVVCGHSGCGAMQGLLNRDAVASLPAVGEWLDFAADTLDRVKRRADAGKDPLAAAVEENVRLQLDHLRTHPSVTKALGAGDLELHGWVYDIGTGEITCCDDETDEFVAMNL